MVPMALSSMVKMQVITAADSVSGAGDINGDGIADLVVGAPRAGSNAGKTYVIFGSKAGWSSPISLSSLNGANGFVLNGENAGDQSGFSVSGAGDINDDGIADLVVGAPGADSTSAGKTYVIFGSKAGWSSPISLSSLNGANGFVLNGENAGDDSGYSVSGAGDINGDGIADLVVGAPVLTLKQVKPMSSLDKQMVRLRQPRVLLLILLLHRQLLPQLHRQLLPQVTLAPSSVVWLAGWWL